MTAVSLLGIVFPCAEVLGILRVGAYGSSEEQCGDETTGLTC